MPYKSPDKYREYQRLWAQNWRAKSKPLAKKRRRANYIKHVDAEKAYHAKWIAERDAAWRAAKNKRDRENRRVRLYGLTLDAYFAIADAQNYRCKICNKIPSDGLVIDHCHSSNKVRGLLCRQCNAAIGLLGDTVEALERAMEYLRGDD